jgi:hypothetical protein
VLFMLDSRTGYMVIHPFTDDNLVLAWLLTFVFTNSVCLKFGVASDSFEVLLFFFCWATL